MSSWSTRRSDKAFKFSPALFSRRLAVEKWYDWGSDGMFSGGGVDYPVNERVLAYQKIALNQCLSANVLSRLENQQLLVDDGADALRPSEVFRALTDGTWAELSKPEGSKEKPFGLRRSAATSSASTSASSARSSWATAVRRSTTFTVTSCSAAWRLPGRRP